MKTSPLVTPLPPSSAPSSTSFASKAVLAVAAIALGALYLSKYHSETISAKALSSYHFCRERFKQISAKIRPYLHLNPSHPLSVKINSSLNSASISIQLQKPPTPKANFVICLDTSSAMQSKSDADAKEGIKCLLTSALSAQQQRSAEIDIAVVGFAGQAKMHCRPTRIQPSTIDAIQKQAFDYRSTGSSNTLAGLLEATRTLEEMAKKNPEATNRLILIANLDEDLPLDKHQDILLRLQAIGSSLSRINYGKGPKKSSAPKGSPKAAPPKSSESTPIISDIFRRAISPYTELVLEAPQLKAGTWSLGSEISKEIAEGSACTVSSLFEGPEVKSLITIYFEKLDAPLDLSKLTFQLDVRNPRGERSKIPVPWNPSYIVIPDRTTL